MRLFSKSLGVQVEVVLGSPQALMSSEGYLWITEKEQCLEEEQNERNSNFPSSVRHHSSARAIQNAKLLHQIN